MLDYRYYHNPSYSNLPLPSVEGGTAPDPFRAVKKFAEACHTDPYGGGTRQTAKVPCIMHYLESAGYHPIVFSIGPASRGVEASAGARNALRPVQISDLREYLKRDYGVILHVGWLRFDSRHNAWIEKGSHSLNAYGFDYMNSWGNDRLVLKVSDPGTNYENRPNRRFYDSVQVAPLERQPGVRYPRMMELVNLQVTGPGFDAPGRIAVLEDIFVFSPTP